MTRLPRRRALPDGLVFAAAFLVVGCFEAWEPDGVADTTGVVEVVGAGDNGGVEAPGSLAAGAAIVAVDPVGAPGVGV